VKSFDADQVTDDAEGGDYEPEQIGFEIGEPVNRGELGWPIL
jgi:hypothetical protein